MVKQRALVSLFGVVILLTGIIFTAFLPMGGASALQITGRSLTLVAQSGNFNGSAPAPAAVDHLFSYHLPTAGNIESIQFQYCTLADGACVTPNGLVTTSATLGAQSGASFATLNNTTNGAPYIFSTSPVTISSVPELVTTQLNNITNPSGSDCSGSFLNNCTFYVRITTYTSDTATTGLVDSGNVAASVNQQVVLQGQMPESLVFCVGATVSETSGVPDCSTVTNSTSPPITFNQLFSPTSTATASSQMAASTNAGSGYTITVWGPTLSSGANQINNMSSSGSSVLGTSQFGMNLVPNTTPSVGSALTPTSDGVNYYGEASPGSGYDVTNDFKFVSGNQVADSFDGTAPFATDAQIYTVSYIANVPGKQAAGTYTTTLTYICTPTF